MQDMHHTQGIVIWPYMGIMHAHGTIYGHIIWSEEFAMQDMHYTHRGTRPLPATLNLVSAIQNGLLDDIQGWLQSDGG